MSCCGQQQGDFQPSYDPLPANISFFFADGVPAPTSGIYELTPAPPGGLSSLGQRVNAQSLNVGNPKPPTNSSPK
ncbi:unnamed protein product [Adineta steineri]|uniref:Uncharacterized protein n=1 Tax=Adineta steineri TaxID=433720 RepID=A0A815RGJ6_9BILA|nr:unnamed protein product [Adineta steineri]CAF1637630.1 unnamed protein product [Adineta steineri]